VPEIVSRHLDEKHSSSLCQLNDSTKIRTR
jgi:hypothetical protein